VGNGFVYNSGYSSSLNLSSSSLMAEFCRGRTNDIPCDCEEFTPLDDTPAKCAECSHGRSKHPKNPSMQPPLDNIKPQPQLPTSRQSVLQMFQGITSKPAGFEQARTESVCGFGSRSVSSGSNGRKAKQKVFYSIFIHSLT
jgi:hypothetical protein